MREALLWSEKSHDTETQCGCVLVRDKTPISTGYNGFIRDINDAVLPNKRPHKYPFMIHAEHNAILNCARQGKSTIGATAYVTGKPCIYCLQYMWQAGIVRIVYSNLSSSKNWEHTNADNQTEAILRLINDLYHGTHNPKLAMEFIDKNRIFPLEKTDNDDTTRIV